MERLSDVNIESFATLPSPEDIKRDLPLSEKAAATAAAGRHAIERIIAGESRLHLLVAGPCSVHSVEGALEYAGRLRALAGRVSDRMLVVMRVYVEKPRTTIGWKGLIYDPALDDSCDIQRGLHLARRLMLDIAEMGLPIATEVLDPVMPQYLADLVSWGVIGARTSESQTHRQLASGLSMPTGFKNATNGSIKVAVEAISTAASRHSFLGVTNDGRSGFFRTRGNRFCHLVLRGGTSGPNHGSEHVAYARELLKKHGAYPAIIVDCSHANSGKRPENQAGVMEDVLRQIVGGETAIIGTMVESYLRSGRQDPSNTTVLDPGLSITDACLGWEETEKLVLHAHEVLGQGREAAP